MSAAPSRVADRSDRRAVLDKPIGLANGSGDPSLDIVNAQMLGDVHLRDDKATPEDTDDDLLIDPVSHVEYDGKSLRIRSDSHVWIRVGNSTFSGRDLRIVLPQAGTRAGKK